LTWIGARLLAAVAIASSLGGAAGLLLHRSYEHDCTATNASGARVVIGTELTTRGQQYLRDNPSDDKDDLLESLAGRSIELAWTTDSIRRCQTALAISGAVWVPLFGVAAVAAVAASRIGRAPPQLRAPQDATPHVFISYTHDDAATAARLKQLLQEHKIDVIIDTDRMVAGETVTAFIHRSIRECTAVVSIISSRSLQSTWVAAETIGGIGRREWGKDIMLVACYLDEQWLQPEFRLRCTADIDRRLQQIETLLPDYAVKKIDTADLNAEKTRLYDLRNNMGTILATLKDSLCLDVREEAFATSGRRLVERVASRAVSAERSAL
jgi:hypothetical protein